MKKAKLDTLGVGESRWVGNSDIVSDQFRIIRSASERIVGNGGQ